MKDRKTDGPRHLDDMCRVTIPRELARLLGWKPKNRTVDGTAVTIAAEGDHIVIRRAESLICPHCGKMIHEYPNEI